VFFRYAGGFGNGDFDQLEAKFFDRGGPGADGIFNQLCGDIHPVDPDVVTVVRTVETVIVQ
jgi:hypothetical protein